MKNIGEFLDLTDKLYIDTSRLADINCQYDFVNAWRTCEILCERIDGARNTVISYIRERQQYNFYMLAMENITFDDSQGEQECEKMIFEVEKIHNASRKSTLNRLRGFQSVIEFSYDNQTFVHENCVKFVQTLDEVIEYLHLE